jgi:AraC-like DNA-binding protein
MLAAVSQQVESHHVTRCGLELSGASEPPAVLLCMEADSGASALRALKGRYRIVSAGVESVRRPLGTTVCAGIVELRDRSGKPNVRLVEHLRAAHPHLILVAVGRVQTADGADVIAMARAGVDHVVFSGIEDLSISLPRVLVNIRRSGPAMAALASLQRMWPRIPKALLDELRARGLDGTSVSDAARRLKMSRRTLARRVQAAGCPPAKALFLAFRLLTAAHALTSARSVEITALTCRFSSASQLRRHLRRIAALSPRRFQQDPMAITELEAAMQRWSLTGTEARPFADFATVARAVARAD